MGKRKEFWDLADSTILGRNKKVELLQIARREHGLVEAYRAQLDLQAEQFKEREALLDQLRAQLENEGTVHKQVLANLIQKFDCQQRNHEQELSRLQCEAENWEKVAQDYKDVVVTQQTEIARLTSVLQNIKRFAKMSPKEAGQAFVDWLFGCQDKGIDGEDVHEDAYTQTVNRKGSQQVSGR